VFLDFAAFRKFACLATTPPEGFSIRRLVSAAAPVIILKRLEKFGALPANQFICFIDMTLFMFSFFLYLFLQDGLTIGENQDFHLNFLRLISDYLSI